MRFWLVLLSCFLCVLKLSAQSVSGIVIDKLSQKPVEYATIELIHLPDSTISKTAATDKKGKFTLDDVQPASYFLRCSFIGFDNVFSNVFKINAVTNHAT